mmetsp:Transcript_46851/g.117282  ORF Transcript_46851/g.117282 Transcript_46851/m.117282 type:complete len:361 (+) Transcript_46851:281-1363(+)
MSAPMKTVGIAAASGEAKLGPWEFSRHAPGPNDVVIDVKYCGVCHSDIHTAKGDWGPAVYPCVPGHEAAGVISAVGSDVTKFKVGDHAGVGCFVDSCLDCSQCHAGDEQYCEKGMTGTYNGKPVHGRAGPVDAPTTYGGYSQTMVVNERFTIKIPQDYPLECAGPLMCAAITVWDPMMHWGVKEGTRVGILGMGGLGMMGLKLAKGLGCEVTVITSSPNKVESCKEMGADRVIVSSSEECMKKAALSLDLILNTVSATHEVATYIPLLASAGTIVQLGGVTTDHKLNQMPLMFNRRSVAGSLIGGIRATQECLDFCHKKGIRPNVEVVSCDKINDVYDILTTKNDAVRRYVLDIANTLTV